MKKLKKRKGNLLQRMMALLLSVELIFCGGGVTPVSVLAQESVSANTADVIVEENEAVSDGNETEEESEAADGMEPEEVSEPKTAVRAADASAQAETSGEGWALDADGKLTITSDTGMTGWCSQRDEESLNNHPHQDAVTAVEIQEGVTSIPEMMLYRCKKLQSVTLPSTVTQIGAGAFRECSGLVSITIPSGVTEIKYRAFQDCLRLELVIMQGETPPMIGNMAFDSCKFKLEKRQGIKVPVGAADSYKTAWSDWASNITTIGNIASGQDWVLDDSGKLTIMSADGMTNWNDVRDTYCAEVKTAEIQAGVTSIEFGTFLDCSNLTEVKIPDSVTTIGNRVFQDCSSLTGITIPKDVTEIGTYAFCDCSNLEEITIPSGVTKINIGTFMNCTLLKNITIPDGVTEIDDLAFRNTALEKITIPDGVETIMDNSFQNCSSLKEVRIPNSVTSINWYSFSGCSSLESITIPAAVTKIEKGAFSNCSSLANVTVLPDTPPSLAQDVFTGCKFVTDTVKGIKVPEGKAGKYKTAWTDWASYIAGDNIVQGTGWVIDEDGKLTIVSDDGMADWAKNENRDRWRKSVKSAEIQNGVTYIEKYGFYYCNCMTGVTIADSVKKIENSAFKSCEVLTDIEIPNSVETMGNDVFGNCKALQKIVIPNSVTNIEWAMFSGCLALTDIEIPGSVTSIGAQAFSGCKSLTGIEIPDSVTSIDRLAFANCSSLTQIKLPSRVTVIAEDMFLRCSSLKSVEISPDVTSIEEGAFRECSSLTGIEIPSGVTSIGGSAFYDCSSLTDIRIPSGVTVIADRVFKGCSSLTEIEIPSGVTSIGQGAFMECSKLREIEIPSGVTSIEPVLFAGCSSLERITMPAGVTSIGEQAFIECGSLTEIKLPAALTEIGMAAFYGCSALTQITIPAGVTDIGVWAFYECGNLESVIMQGSKPPTLGIMDEETGETQVFASCRFVTESTQGIKVPAKTADDYKTAWPEWKDYIAETAGTDRTDAEKVKAAEEAVKAALTDYEVTNATTKEDLQAAIDKAVKDALTAAGIDGSGVTVTVENFQKTEATADAAGNVIGTIKITGGTESAEVTLDKPIEKLPLTPAAQVAAVKDAIAAAVKEAVDKALAGTEITNDNAEEIADKLVEEILPAVLPDAIEKAYADTGVSPDAVTVDTGNLNITVDPAAGDSQGKIRISIPVASTEDPGQAGAAEVQVPVTKPGGETDPDKDAEEAKKALEDELGKITVTNDTTEDDIRKAIEGALGDKGTVEGIEQFEKTDATEDTPGKLILKIKVIINGKPVIIELTVIIEPLGKKTGVYVRFTDYDRLGEDSVPCYKYTGTAIKPAVEVYNNETLLTPGTDYTIGYKNNKKPGSTAALTVKGKGNFTGISNVVNFTIVNADIEEDTDHPTEMTVIAKTKVTPVIMHGTRKLTTKDYKLEGDGLVGGKYEAVTAEGAPNILTVTGIGSYAGSSFTIRVRVIDRKDAGKLTVTVDKTFKPVYDGTALNLSALLKKTSEGEGAITVTDAKDKTKILTEGTDFTIACTSSLSDAGTVRFTVTGMGAYTGNVTKTFKINPLKVTDNSKFSVTFDEGKVYEYKATGVTVDNLAVTYLGETDSPEDDKPLIQGVDYKVTYSNHRKVSGKNSAALKIVFLGNYKGSTAVSKPFQVVTAKLSPTNTKVTVPDKVYTKANRGYKSTPIVTVDGVTLKASQYTVEYAWATASEAEDDTKYVTDKNVKITIAEQDAYARVKVTITPKVTGSYALAGGAALTGEYYVRKTVNATDLTRAKVTFHNKAGTQLKALEYNGSSFYTPAGNDPEAETAPEDANAVYVSVTVKGKLVAPELYDVEWTNATLKGKATVVIRGKGEATAKGMAVGSRNQSINIKAMTLKGKTLKSFMENAANAVNSIRELFF